MKMLRKSLIVVMLFFLWTMSTGGMFRSFSNNSNQAAASGVTADAAPAGSGVATPDKRKTAERKDMPPEGSTAYYDLEIRERFKIKDYAGAKVLLDEAIKKYPQMSAIHELMGRYYLHEAETGMAGKNASAYYDKARYYLIRAIQIDEKNVQARYYMLQVETDTKHYSSAIVYCNDLLEENPYNENLWRKKIDLYRKLGDNAEADRLLERIYTIYPGDDQLQKDMVERKTIKAKQQRDHGDVLGQEQTLRQLVELDPKNGDHYNALANLLYRTGRISEAAEVAGQGASVTNHAEFVEKRASMLCEMNRHREAVEYVKTYMKRMKNGSLASLLSELEMEAARAAQYNDAYTAYAKIYESQHSMEALDYLVNTSIQRWYLDDAAIYIEEALKRKGESQKLLYSQYLVHKRLGNDRKANTLLQHLYERYPDDEGIAEEMMLLWLDDAKELMGQDQYAEAVPILEKVYDAHTYPYIKEAAFHRLYSCYYQTRQYAKAERLLAQMEGTASITQAASLYNAWGKPKKALDSLAKAYSECPHTDTDTRSLIATTYEEIAIPYVKSLLAAGRVNDAAKQLEEAVTICPDNIDILRYGITAAQRKGDAETAAFFIGRGLDLYPADPYFILKDAQQRHLSGDNKATLEEIRPLLDEYAGDSLLIALYSETSIDIAGELLHAHQPDDALMIIQSALDIDPDNSTLYYVQGQAYEQKKEWKLAYESYKHYKPGYAELAEYKHHFEELSRHMLRNSLSLEYQQARPGNEDVVSGNAYLNYVHRYSSRTTINAGLAYAGRDGASAQSDTEMTRGGTGVQLSAGYEHAFTPRFTAKIEAAGATRYFPIVMARLSGTYDMPRDWQLSAFASYRLLRSYAGVYGWQSNVVGYDPVTQNPIYGDAEYVRTGWDESRKSMFQLGAGATKTIDKFAIGGELIGLYFAKKFYFNTNVKMKFNPWEGNSSHIFAVGGVGTAPESSLIDRSLPVAFNKVNTYVGLGGSYFINRYLTLNLAGTWYTMLSQSERLTTTYIANDPFIREDYRNYFYIHGSVLISF